MPQNNINGTVTDISLDIVKVTNFDNTTVTIPPYSLVSGSFINWRGMEESGGRRIMREYVIKLDGITPCSAEFLERMKVLEHVRMGGALPELHLPLPGTEPNAFIVVCTTAAPDDDLYIDVGISAQSMLLQAVEIGLNGLCIRAFDREGIKRALGLTLEPVLVMALGRSVEKAETVEIPADGNHAYYRRDGRHYVPKVRAGELIIPHACGQQH